MHAEGVVTGRFGRVVTFAAICLLMTTSAVGADTEGDGKGVGVEQNANGSATAKGEVTGQDRGLWARRSPGDGCVYEPAFVDGFPTQPVEPSIMVNGVLNMFYVARCPNSNVFYWQALPTRTQLVATVRAQAQREVPRPVPQFFPTTVLSEYAFVRWPTYVWLEPSMRQPVTVTASTPQLSVTATVTPNSLTFTPADHDPTVCAATVNRPSQQFLDDHPPLDPFERSPLVCEFRFTKTSYGQPDNKYPTTVTVDWTLTWTASDATAGVITGITTTQALNIGVAKIQIINTTRSST